MDALSVPSGVMRPVRGTHPPGGLRPMRVLGIVRMRRHLARFLSDDALRIIKRGMQPPIPGCEHDQRRQ